MGAVRIVKYIEENYSPSFTIFAKKNLPKPQDSINFGF